MKLTRNSFNPANLSRSNATPSKSGGPKGAHDPSNPVRNGNETARGLSLKPTANETPAPDPRGSNKLNANNPEGGGRRYQNNDMQQKPNGFMETRADSGQLAGVAFNATQGHQLVGSSAYNAPDSHTVDGSVPISHAPVKLAQNSAISPDAYNALPKNQRQGLKGEALDHKQSYIKEFHSNTGDINANNLVLNQTRKDYTYINERESGAINKQGAGGVGYTLAGGKIEHEVDSKFGKTQISGSVDVGASMGAEGELQASRKKGEEALTAHGKLGMTAGLNSSINVDHKFTDNLAVGTNAFLNAGVTSNHEASAAFDKKDRTAMFKVSSYNQAGVHAGAGVSGQAGPVKAELMAGKIIGPAAVFNMAGGMERGVLHTSMDVGLSPGMGGRVRAGASVDMNPAIDRTQGEVRHQKLKNSEGFQNLDANLQAKVKDQSRNEHVKFRKPSAEVEGRVNRTTVDENKVFKDVQNQLKDGRSVLAFNDKLHFAPDSMGSSDLSSLTADLNKVGK